MTSETKMQELLSALTEAILANDPNADAMIEHYDVPRKETNSLAHLIRRLDRTLTTVQPAARYRQQLKQDLLGMRKQGLIWRWRRLPARVQIAAAFAVIGGFLLLGRGLTLNELRRRALELIEVEEARASLQG